MVIKKVKKTIKENKLINKDEHIVIGLSGGPDSVCLFNVLMELKDEMGLTIHPVHLNHKFRPGAADRDQHYVEELCRERGLRCRTFTVDCNKLAEELNMTSEEAGRKARYDAFHQVAKEIADELCELPQNITGCTKEGPSVKIAVAQNANDQAETVLFRLLRGTGVDGLAGIAYEREERGFKVIRPLLEVPRNEIEEYCRAKSLNPVTDHTNNEAIYARNKIRLELIPYLEKDYNENVKEGLVRLSRIAAADKDYLWQEAEKAYRKVILSESAGSRENNTSQINDMLSTSHQNDVKEFDMVHCREVVIDRIGLAQLHKAIRHRVIFKAFAEVGLDSDITEERLEAADFIIEKKQGSKTVQFPHEYRIQVVSGKVRFFKESRES